MKQLQYQIEQQRLELVQDATLKMAYNFDDNGNLRESHDIHSKGTNNGLD